MKFALVILLLIIPPFLFATLGQWEPAEIDTTESTVMLKNPFMGYPATVAISLKPKGTQVFNPSGFTWFYVNLKNFSAGNVQDVPVGGNDIALSDDALSAFSETLKNLQKNGGSCLMRFVYDWDGIRGCEPKNFKFLIKHLRQLCAVANQFPDVVLGFECGLVGVFGEMHSSIYCDKKYSNQIIETYLAHTSEKQFLLLRTPEYIANYLNISREDLFKTKIKKGQKASRLGIFNDGYMNSETDLGTWKNREKEIPFLFNQSEQTPYGGEYGSAFDKNLLPNSACIPENAIPEMYRTHVSFIRGNVYKIDEKNNTIFGYDQFSYSPKYEKPWFPNNTAFYGSDCYSFITAHLGYRIVLRASRVASFSQNERKIRLQGTLENTGFANILHTPTAEIILKKGETIIPFKIDFDVRRLKSCHVLNYDFSLNLSEKIPSGRYEIFLRLSHCHISEHAKAKSGIRFANNGAIFSEKLGANKLGEITLSNPNTDKIKKTDARKRSNVCFLLEDKG